MKGRKPSARGSKRAAPPEGQRLGLLGRSRTRGRTSGDETRAGGGSRSSSTSPRRPGSSSTGSSTQRRVGGATLSTIAAGSSPRPTLRPRAKRTSTPLKGRRGASAAAASPGANPLAVGLAAGVGDQARKRRRTPEDEGFAALMRAAEQLREQLREMEEDEEEDEEEEDSDELEDLLETLAEVDEDDESESESEFSVVSLIADDDEDDLGDEEEEAEPKEEVPSAVAEKRAGRSKSRSAQNTPQLRPRSAPPASSSDEEEEEEEELHIFLALPGVPMPPRKPKLLLPRRRKHATHSCTLVLDLDETLVAARGKEVLIRPGACALLKKAREMDCEIVLWTAGVHQHTQKVISAIDKAVDPHQSVIWFDHLIYRSPKWYSDARPVKDLTLLGRPATQLMLLDNNPASATLQSGNTLLVEDFFGEGTDTQLGLVQSVLTDVVSGLRHNKTVGDLLMGSAKVMTRIIPNIPHAKTTKFHMLVEGSMPKRVYGGAVVEGF